MQIEAQGTLLTPLHLEYMALLPKNPINILIK